MKIRATKRYEIDAGHRLARHDGKCGFLHGHRYAVEATVSGMVDGVGVVLDFSSIKDALACVLGPWDHAVVLEAGDPLVDLLLSAGQQVVVVPFAPSAENIALHVADALAQLLDLPAWGGGSLAVENVRVWETPTSFADAAPGGSS